ncbi:hypothetical protein Tco_1282215 [Tanacetum coccineum]
MVVNSKLKELCTHKGIVTPMLKLCVFSKEGGLIPKKVEACLNLLEVDSPELFPCKSALSDGCRFALALNGKGKYAEPCMDRNVNLRCYSLLIKHITVIYLWLLAISSVDKE